MTIPASSISVCTKRSASALPTTQARRPQDRGGLDSFKGKSIPAWFHLPPGTGGGQGAGGHRHSGHGQLQESSVALANDRWMQRGVACWRFDGPGQYESPLLGVYVSMQS